MIPWKDIFVKPEFYNSIMFCILKSNMFSHNNIIAICQGWIFDENLSYAIFLNKKSLYWCTGHGKSDVIFYWFHEQVQIGLKNKTKKSKWNKIFFTKLLTNLD